MLKVAIIYGGVSVHCNIRLWSHVLFNTQHTCSECKDTKEIAVQFFKHTSQNSFDIYITNKPAS